MKRIFLTTTFLVFGALYTISFAQISDMIYAKPEDYTNDIFKRTLLIEVIEQDQWIIDNYKDQIAKAKKEEKKKQFQKDLDGYLQFNKTFNGQLKSAVDKYWKLNSNIVYKTKKEILDIPKTERNKYVILFYQEVGDNGTIHDRVSGMAVPMLIYDRLERDYTSRMDLVPDYKIYIPSSYLRKDGAYVDADIIFTIRAMQDNINYIISSGNKKPFNFEKFAKVMAAQNCKNLSSKVILVEAKLIHETLQPGEIKNVCKAEYKLVSAEEVNNSIKEEKEGEAVILSIPFGLAKSGYGSGTIASVTIASYAYVKVIADSKTGEILGFMEPKSSGFYDYSLRLSVLNVLCNCGEDSKK